MKQVSFQDKYLEHFKVYQPQTLFEPDLSLIKDNICPLCFSRLKNIKGKILMCNSLKHKKPFIKKL